MKKLLMILICSVMTVAGLVASEEGACRVRSIEFIRKEPMRTNEGALRRFVDIQVGDEFDSAEEFLQYVDLEQKDLLNTRYFNEATITYVEGAVGEDGVTPVDVTVTVKDGWTLVPIPYPIPNSNLGKNGWGFGTEIYYDNFFGTMTNFAFLGEVGIAFGEPTNKLRHWYVKPSLKGIKLGKLTFSIDLDQSFSTDRWLDKNIVLQEFTRDHSALSLSSSIDLPGNWSYSFTPSFGANYNYDWRVLVDDDNMAKTDSGIYKNREDFLYAGFSHGVNFGRVDWEGTFRQGYTFGLGNANRFSMSRPAQTQKVSPYFVSDLGAHAAYYLPFGKFFNYTTRFDTLVVFNDIYRGLGSKLRGVKNDSMIGSVGFFWKNTLVIQPHKTLKNFNFQLHPFVDVGLSFDYNNPGDIKNNIGLGTGLELLFMLGSVNLRGWVAYDPINNFFDISYGIGLPY